MRGASRIVWAGAPVSIAVAVLVASASPLVATEDSRTYTRSCADSVYGELGDEWRKSSIIVGRVAFVGARGYRDAPRRWFRPDDNGRYRTQKVMIQVENGDDVVVRVARRARKEAGLVYDPSLFGRRLKIAATDYRVRFDVCSNIAENPHGAEVTQYNGGFVVSRARCVPLDVLTETGERIERIRISFGAGRC